MKLKITIPRNILDDEDKLCEFLANLDSENGKIKSITAKGFIHTITFHKN